MAHGRGLALDVSGIRTEEMLTSIDQMKVAIMGMAEYVQEINANVNHVRAELGGQKQFPRTRAEGVPNSPVDLQVGVARQALESASGQLSNNFIKALAGLANASAIAGANVSHAANVMMRGVVTNTVQLGGVLAYMPRLIFLDGPTQFVEVLRLIRSNQIRLPNDIDSAIDTLISFANQYRDSKIGENFNPAFTFLPNLFKGVGDFMVTFLDSLFVFFA